MSNSEDNLLSDEAEVEEEEGEEETVTVEESEIDKVKPVIFISGFVTFLFCLGLWDLFMGMEPNGCSMTYMYEWPQYVQIKMNQV